MKKTMFMLAALCGVCAADTMSLDLLASSANWTFGHNNPDKYTVPSLTDGAITYKNGDWSRGYAVNDLTDITLTADKTMTVEMIISSSNWDSNKTLALVGTNGAVVIGGSYKTYQAKLGTAAAADTYYQFQGATTGGTYVTTEYTYDDIMKANEPITLTLEIAPQTFLGQTNFIANAYVNGNNMGYAFLSSDTYTLDKIVISLDEGAATQTVSALTLTVTPEPATATLSLLALAGLAARRRRH